MVKVCVLVYSQDYTFYADSQFMVDQRITFFILPGCVREHSRVCDVNMVWLISPVNILADCSQASTENTENTSLTRLFLQLFLISSLMVCHS